MSKPATKMSPREQFAQKIRKQNMDGIIQDIQRDFQAETDPNRKKNIAACLAEAKKTGTYVSSLHTLFAISGQACIARHAVFDNKLATLDARGQKLVYAMRGTAEQNMAGTPGSNTVTAGPNKVSGPTRDQMLAVATFTNVEPKLDYSGPTTMHQIFAIVRIPATHRATGLTAEELRKVEAGSKFTVCFDTGSEVQTIEKLVWDEMSGKGRFYGSKTATGRVRGATGHEQVRTYVKVEIGYFRDDARKIQLGSWRTINANFSEREFEHNLSGREIFEDYDFFLPQGHGALLMGTNKVALAWEYMMRSRDIKEIALINQWAAAEVAKARNPAAQGAAA